MKNVQVRAGYVLHIGTVEGALRVGDQLKCCVDEVALNLLLINYYAVFCSL